MSGLSAARATLRLLGVMRIDPEMALQMSNTTSAWIKNNKVFGTADEDALEE
jgi:hypothetical protein